MYRIHLNLNYLKIHGLVGLFNGVSNCLGGYLKMKFDSFVHVIH